MTVLRVFIAYFFPLVVTVLLYLPLREFSQAQVEGNVLGLSIQLGGPVAAYAALVILSTHLLRRVMERHDPDLHTKSLLAGTWEVVSTSRGRSGTPKTATGRQTIVLTGQDLSVSGTLTYDDGATLGNWWSIHVAIKGQRLEIFYLLTDHHEEVEPFEWAGLAKINIGPMLRERRPRGEVKLRGDWQVYGPEPKSGEVVYTRQFDD